MPGELFKIIIYVKDMGRMVEFYRDQLKLQLTYPLDLTDYTAEYWVTFQAGAVTLALHGGGPGEQRAGAPRFGFEVNGIEQRRLELTASGVDASEVREAVAGVKVVDCRDPEGNGFFIEEHC